MYGAVASKALDDEKLVAAVLEDWRSAPVAPKLRAVLGLLEKLTLEPELVGPEDVRPLRGAGLSDQEIEEAIQVCALLNVITRLADAFGFEVPPPEEVERGTEFLLRRGYGG